MIANIDERLTTAQAARKASVSNETIRLWVKTGRLPATKIATGQFRIALADLERVLNLRPNAQQS